MRRRNFHNDQRSRDTTNQAPALVAQVELGLEVGAGVADKLERVAEVVGDDHVAGQLGHETQEGPG